MHKGGIEIFISFARKHREPRFFGGSIGKYKTGNNNNNIIIE